MRADVNAGISLPIHNKVLVDVQNLSTVKGFLFRKFNWIFFRTCNKRSSGKMENRTIYAFGIAVMFLAIIGITATIVSYSNMSAKEVKGRLGIIIDAGGSGTRLYVYEYKKNEKIHQIDYIKCEKKGLTNYKSNPNLIKDLLEKCLKNSEKDVPVERRKTVPIYMEATAGMRVLRLLNETAYNKIWSVARETLKKSDYNFRKAGTLKGSEEGTYGWTALNYLNGGFTNNKILGALELGSTSMQITFIPAKKNFIGGNETVKINDKHYKVYVHSYLCYGRNAFERRYLAKLAVDQNYSSIVKDPCGHKGRESKRKSDYLWAAPCCSGKYALKTFGEELKGPANKEYTFQGQSNPAACLKSIGKLFDNSKCKHPSCGFYGVAQPKVNGPYAAFSAFYYPVSFLNMSKTANRSEYEADVKRICSMTAAQAKQIPGPESFKYSYCLSSAFEYTFLTKGVHFNDSTWKIRFTKKINGQSIAWSLGSQVAKREEMSQDIMEYSRPITKKFMIAIVAISSAFIVAAVVMISVAARKRSGYERY